MQTKAQKARKSIIDDEPIPEVMPKTTKKEFVIGILKSKFCIIFSIIFIIFIIVVVAVVFSVADVGGPLVEPKWAGWSNWSSCSVTCGNGNRQREAKCETGKNSELGCKLNKTTEDRAKSKYGNQICSLESCNSWGRWLSWVPCSLTCGSGNRIRKRNCFDLEQNLSNDNACEGNQTDVQICQTNLCREYPFPVYYGLFITI